MTPRPLWISQRVKAQFAGLLCAFVVVLTGVQGGTGVVYFLVASRNAERNDSYVLPLTKPEDVAEARRELTELPFTNRLIVVARIGAGADGINRDHQAPGKPAWSWHVTEFVKFAEGVIETMDGTPTQVEEDVAFWTTAPQRGTIGFVGHRLVAELTREQVFFASARVTAEGVRLQWLELGTNYVYTVEISSSLDPVSWVPAMGGSWPTTATNWTDTALPVSGPRFYRVKAEQKLTP